MRWDIDSGFGGVNGTVITNADPNAFNTVEDRENMVLRALDVSSVAGRK